jgi:hypothetical protein
LTLFNDIILEEVTASGNNLLMLAVISKNLDWIKKLLVRCNEETILKINRIDNNILTLAMYSNKLSVVNCILDNLSLKTLEKIYMQKDSQQKNILNSVEERFISEEIKLVVYTKLEDIKNSYHQSFDGVLNSVS